jgi:hypothetical protein
MVVGWLLVVDTVGWIFFLGMLIEMPYKLFVCVCFSSFPNYQPNRAYIILIWF